MKGNLIIDLQFGSTGKGLIAGYLAERDNPDTVVTAWAPNAGHTYIDSSGRRFVHTQLANGIVSANLQRVLIGPGSLVNPEALAFELDAAADLLEGVSVAIHPNAAIVTPVHKQKEEDGTMHKIGSTRKGVGAAMIERIERNPERWNVAYNGEPHPYLEKFGLSHLVVSQRDYDAYIDEAEVMQVEGAQGYSLSLYHGFYPYCTSRDVSTHQILADCGIPPKLGRQLRVVGCLRTYPIRVANRYDDKGEEIGWSGPTYPDSVEISFESIGQETEYTTVTKLPRRIFTFSHLQFAEAVRQCGVDDIFVNFLNYLPSDQARTRFLTDLGVTLEQQELDAHVRYLGRGPTYADISELPAIDGDMPIAIADLQARVWQFAEETFGKGREDAAWKKLFEEIGETLKSPYDPLEWGDVFIMLLDLASIYDVDAGSATLDKLDIIRRRSWRRTATGTYQHTKADK